MTNCILKRSIVFQPLRPPFDKACRAVDQWKIFVDYLCCAGPGALTKNQERQKCFPRNVVRYNSQNANISKYDVVMSISHHFAVTGAGSKEALSEALSLLLL